jgi:phosphonate transport system substrate-binding protein
MKLREKMKIMTRYCLIFTIVVMSCYANKAQAEEQTYNLGIPSAIPQEGFQSLADYLTVKIKKRVNFVSLESYKEFVEKIINNKVQFAIMGPVQYIEAKWKYPELIYLATAQTMKQGRQRAYYFGHIVVRKDSGITDIAQLQDRSFSFINSLSSSGYRFPRMYFYKKRINPETFFSKIVFAGTHQKGTDMVAAGTIDAVSTWDLNLWTAQEKYGNIFSSIAKIGPIVSLPFVVNHNVSSDIVLAVKKAILDIQPGDLSKKFPYSGFQVFSDQNYDNVREIYNFPFLDSLAPNILNTAVKSHDLNQIFKALDKLNYQKRTNREFMENELKDKVFTFTGNYSGRVANIYFQDGWVLLKQAMVFLMDNGRRVYIKTKNSETDSGSNLESKLKTNLAPNIKFNLKSGEMVKLKAKMIGIKGFDDPVMEETNDKFE